MGWPATVLVEHHGTAATGELPHGVYHVGSRGLDREAVLRDEAERDKWTDLLDCVAARRDATERRPRVSVADQPVRARVGHALWRRQRSGHL